MLTIGDAATQLGVSRRRVAWWELNGHLVGVEDDTGRAGVSIASVEAQAAWRRSAGPLRRLGRLVLDLIGWVS